MSDESSLKNSAVRFLREEEVALLRALLANHPLGQLVLPGLEQTTARNMQDGGMGSIRFSDSSGERRMLECIAEADYVDSDGVSVSIALNIDKNGRPFELDIWKVDFSPLVKYPTPQTIRNVRHVPR